MVILDDIVHLLIQLFFQVQNFCSLNHISLPRIGQHEFMPQLAEQLLPHLVLKRLQEFRQRRLGNIQRISGFCDVLVLCNS